MYKQTLLEDKGFIFNIYRLQSLFKGRFEKELVARHGARGCKGNLKVVNTKALRRVFILSIKKCKKYLYYKSLILQNQK